jgi:hypothetical protein
MSATERSLFSPIFSEALAHRRGIVADDAALAILAPTMDRTLVDLFEFQTTDCAAGDAYRPEQQTLRDLYEVRAYRSNETTLVDAWEVGGDDLEFADWEEKTRDVCRIVVEKPARGIGYESWRRARSWCGEELFL